MLGKLIKYEFKSTSRVMWFLYGALIVVGALLGLLFRIDREGGLDIYSPMSGPLDTLLTGGEGVYSLLLGILMGIYVLMIQAIFIMTIIMIITRFNKNLLGGEGYLMHTLPVKTSSLILSKGIVAFIWGIIAVVAGLLSGLLFSITSGFLRLVLEQIRWDDIKELLSVIFSREAILSIVFMIVGSIAGILAFYFAMSLGNLANKNKFFYAVLAYIGIQIVITIIFSVIGTSSGGLFGVLVERGGFASYLIIQIIQQLILGVIFFFGSNYILKNKLNLE